jgi:hypothetical protein
MQKLFGVFHNYIFNKKMKMKFFIYSMEIIISMGPSKYVNELIIPSGQI